MIKQGWLLILFFFIANTLSGCAGTLLSGASLVYDRHHVYKKLSDYHLVKMINDVLAVNRTFNNAESVIDIVVFNGDILLAGHVPTAELMDELRLRMRTIHGYRRFYNEIVVLKTSSNSVQDSWITTKIRSQIFADESIDPNSFKIVTTDCIVYLMGDVKPDQAEKVIKIARSTKGVERVVKLMKYFTYESAKNVA